MNQSSQLAIKLSTKRPGLSMVKEKCTTTEHKWADTFLCTYMLTLPLNP